MKKIKLNKKQGIIISSIIALVVVIAVLFNLPKSNKTLILNDSAKDGIVIELGNQIPTDKETYLNVEQMDSEILEKVEVETNATETEFPLVGEYDVIITVDTETLKVNVEVKDTTAPAFNENINSEISTTKGVEVDLVDIYKYDVTDLSEVTLTVVGDVDYSVAGAYNVMIVVTDAYENKTEKEITVNVVEATISLNKTNLTLTAGTSETLTATVVGKDNVITWASSDTSIATVDSNGKVTGIKAGKVTVTATANGVNTTASVTVNAKAATPSTPAPSNPNTNTGGNTTPTTPSNPAPTNPGASGGNSTVIYTPESMLERINKVRSQLGETKLVMRSELVEAARRDKGKGTEIISYLRSVGYCDANEIICQQLNYSYATTSSSAFANGISDNLSNDYKYIGIVYENGVWYSVASK